MASELYLAFVLTCVLLALTPGPSMALFIANGTAHGVRAALLTVAGNVLGLSMLVLVATLGMHSLMVFMAEWFDVLRWLGAAYLVWLGIACMRRMRHAGDILEAQPQARGSWFWQGLAVSLSNPKVLLFLGAFFPQFVDPGAAPGPQLTLLALTFVVVLGAVDAAMAAAVGRARFWFTARRRRVADGISGVLLICGGVWLAMARRP